METQVALRLWAILGNIINTDWNEREGENEKASVTPKTPSTSKALAKATTSTDQSCCRDAALEPGLEQPPGHGCLRIHLKVIQGTCPRNHNQGDNHWVAFHYLDSLQCQAVLVITKLVLCPPPAAKAQSQRGPFFHHSQR